MEKLPNEPIPAFHPRPIAGIAKDPAKSGQIRFNPSRKFFVAMDERQTGGVK
jgi:hypothetical protein